MSESPYHGLDESAPDFREKRKRLAEVRKAKMMAVINRLADIYGGLSSRPDCIFDDPDDKGSPMVVKCDFGGTPIFVRCALNGDPTINFIREGKGFQDLYYFTMVKDGYARNLQGFLDKIDE